MSRASVLIAIVVMCLLAAGSWMALRPKSVTMAPVPLVATDLAGAAIIRLSDRESELRLRRGSLPEQWLLEHAHPGIEAGGSAWPVDPTRVRALLRLVMDLRAEGPPLDEATGTRVLVRFEDATERVLAEITVSGESLGGLAVAQTSAGRARIEDRFAAMFRADNVLSWRQAVAMVRTPQPATRLICRSRQNAASAEEVVDLRRAGNGWVLMAPVTTDAEADDATALARAMESVQFVDLIEKSTDDGTLGLKAPLRVYQMESVLGVLESTQTLPGSGSAPRQTLVQTLEIGGPAPTSGTRFARVTAVQVNGAAGSEEKIVWGPQVGIVDVSTISSLRAGPEHLIARRAVRLPAVDIAAIGGRVGDMSEEIRYEREASAWRVSDAVRASRIDRLVTLLTQTAAESAVPRGRDVVAGTPTAALTLYERRGNVVASLRIWEGIVGSGAAGKPEVRGLIVDDGTVIRRIACEDAGALINVFESSSTTVPPAVEPR